MYNTAGYETVCINRHSTDRDMRKCVSVFVIHRKITIKSREKLPVVIARQ